MKLKSFLFIGIFLFLINIVYAQTSVMIMDISAIPDIIVDSITLEPLQTDSVDMIVLFKIKNVQQASKAYIYFGTSQGIYDVLYVEANFIDVSGIYYTELNGVQSEIINYAGKVIIELSDQQNNDYSCVTLFVEDINGQNTSSLYSFK